MPRVLLAGAACTLLVVTTALPEEAARDKSTVRGWFSCDRCAPAARVKAAQISPATRDCVQRCLGEGAGLVFLDEKARDILRVVNPEAAKGQESRYVEVTGAVDRQAKSLTVGSVRGRSSSQDAARAARRMIELRGQLDRLLPLACHWAEEQAELLRGEGRELDAPEQDLARAVGVRMPERVRVSVVRSIPAPTDPLLSAACARGGFLGPDTVGLTLGHGVYLKQGVVGARRTVFAHELRHVAQYEGYGSISAYLAVYIPELLEYGYDKAPFEVDARKAEARGRLATGGRSGVLPGA